jgi:anti-sigma B factor antagonist
VPQPDPTSPDRLYDKQTWPGHNLAPSTGHHTRGHASRPTTVTPGSKHRAGRRLDLTVHPGLDALEIAVSGDLDLATSRPLVVEVIRHLREHDGVLVVDLAGVSFCDSTGMSALIQIRKHCNSSGRLLALTNLTPEVHRVVVELARLGHYLNVQQPRPEPRSG